MALINFIGLSSDDAYNLSRALASGSSKLYQDYLRSMLITSQRLSNGNRYTLPRTI